MQPCCSKNNNTTLSNDNSTLKDTVKSYLLISPTVYNKNDSSTKKICQLIERYFIAKDSLITYYRDWTKTSLKNYRYPDYLIRSSIAEFDNYRIIPNLISIEKVRNYWRAKIAYNAFENNEFKGLITIYNFGVKIEDNAFKLFNIFDEADLKLIKIDSCYFYVDNESNADTNNIHKMLTFNKKMSLIFGVNEKFKYVNVKDEKKLNNLLGYDFEMYMFIPTLSSAFTDLENKTIYASNNSFYYPHELVHIYVNEIYGSTCHKWFDEGLATYFGGSMGLTLDEHLSKLNIYLKDNNKINLNNLLDYVRIDEVTSYKYTIGGLLCKLMFEKEGNPGIFKLLKSGKSSSEFYETIEKCLGVKKENLNDFIRKELKKY